MINNGLPDESEWVNAFVNTPMFDNILHSVRNIRQNEVVTYFDIDNKVEEQRLTPRFDSMMRGELDLQPFYILEYISSKSSEPIYDIGCGYNFFKKFYNIIGIDSRSVYADLQSSYDLEMAKKYKGKMENAISINAIHFCDPSDLKDRVRGFFDMVKPSGYAYLAINVARIFDDMFDFDILSEDQKNKANIILSAYAKANVLDICEDEVIYWKDTIDNEFDSYMNGNIKILIRKRPE